MLAKQSIENVINAMRLVANTMQMGCGGALVETTPFDRIVAGSNPTLAAK